MLRMVAIGLPWLREDLLRLSIPEVWFGVILLKRLPNFTTLDDINEVSFFTLLEEFTATCPLAVFKLLV